MGGRPTVEWLRGGAPSTLVNPQSGSPSVHRRPLHPAWRRHLAAGGGIAIYPHSTSLSSGSHGGSRAPVMASSMHHQVAVLVLPAQCTDPRSVVVKKVKNR
jgi:hypothetical protein